MQDREFKILTRVGLEELSFDVHLRRALINAGYKTLIDVFRATDDELDQDLDLNALDALDALKARFAKDPKRFLSDITGAYLADNRAKANRVIASNSRGRIDIDRPTDSNQTHRGKRTQESSIGILPNKEFVSALEGLERKCRDALALLADHSENAVIAECFPQLALDMEALRFAYVELFEHYRHSVGKAVRLVCEHFPNSFLVFVAYSASEDFDGEAFWINLFKLLGVNSQTVGRDFKAAFYQGVRDRGLPFFTPDEGELYYRNTALLHGGFSESFWLPLWKDILLPYARENKGKVLSKREIAQLLLAVKNGDSRYELNRAYARKIIEKAPISMLEPLVESALAVAFDVTDSETDRSGASESFNMMSSHGLNDAAMQALRQILENRRIQRGKRLVYLPSAELRIEPASGNVLLHWDAQRLPAAFAGRLVEYRVNGEVRHASEFVMSVGKSVLQEVEISLRPSERFDIELVLRDKDENRSQLASSRQSFDRSRPGVYEFIESTDGVFRLRKKNSRIRTQRTVAYLTKGNLKVIPGSGMVELEVYDADKNWGGASIQLFRVEPGSAGSIINRYTGEEVACWKEGYRAEIDRSRLIGKTIDKRDLYGFDYLRDYGTNASLPEITIEAEDVDSIRDDLEISCVCDGQRVSLPFKAIHDEDGYEFLQSGECVISPRETLAIGRFVRDGRIRIVQKSSKQVILNYQFAVAPIRAFGIDEISWQNGALTATYVFEAMSDMTILLDDDEGDYEMVRNDTYYFDEDLSAESKRLSIKSDVTGETMDVILYLAAISVSMPNELLRINKERPICLLDADSADGKISINAWGRRRGRFAYAFMGMEPVLYKKLSGNAAYSFDMFARTERFAMEGAPQRKDVKLTVSYGEKYKAGERIPATAEVDLLECTTGYDMGRPSIRWRDGKAFLGFASAAPIDFEIRFFDERRRQCYGVAELYEGERAVAVPSDALYALDTRKQVAVTLVPISLFGEPDEDMASTLVFGR